MKSSKFFSLTLTAAVAGLLAAAPGPVAAQAQGQAQAQAQAPSGKVGFVNTQRVMKESRASQAAQNALEAEFKKRDAEIAAGPKDQADRRRRALLEDMNLKREDSLKQLVDRANATIKRIADAENFDAIFVEASYAHPRIDITDRVIKALDAVR